MTRPFLPGQIYTGLSLVDDQVLWAQKPMSSLMGLFASYCISFFQKACLGLTPILRTSSTHISNLSVKAILLGLNSVAMASSNSFALITPTLRRFCKSKKVNALPFIYHDNIDSHPLAKMTVTAMICVIGNMSAGLHLRFFKKLRMLFAWKEEPPYQKTVPSCLKSNYNTSGNKFQGIEKYIWMDSLSSIILVSVHLWLYKFLFQFKIFQYVV